MWIVALGTEAQLGLRCNNLHTEGAFIDLFSVSLYILRKQLLRARMAVPLDERKVHARRCCDVDSLFLPVTYSVKNRRMLPVSIGG